MGALCSAQRDGEYEDPERLQQLLQEGVEKDLKIAALQEQCEELLDAQLDAQRDANFERRTSKEAVSAEEVQALRKENEELRQRLRDTVNELAALREADANAATGMAPRIEAAAIRASVSQKAEGSFRRTSLSMSGLPMQRRPSGGDLSEQIRLSALGVRASMTMRSEKKLVGRELAMRATSPAPDAPADEWPRCPATGAVAARGDVASREQKSVETLLGQHRDAVDALRAALGDAADAAAHDDLWLLRFVLSAKGDAKRAQNAALETIRYRADNAATLALAAAGSPHPLADSLGGLLRQDVQRGVSRRGEPLLVVRGGHCKVRELMRAHSAREVADYINFCKEAAFLACDRETRRTGRLVKMITVIDMKDFRWSDFDQRFLNALGKAEKVGELCYPQLLGLAVVVNAPAIMSMLWGLAKRVLPAATREKVRFCASRDTEAETAARCPYAAHAWAPDALSDFLGGRAAPTGMLRLHADAEERA